MADTNSQTPPVRPPFDDTDADIIIRSADGVDFRLYKVVLAKASSVFRDMFTLPDGSQRVGEPQVVDVTEDADTLEGLLRFCYPVSRPAFQSLDELGPVLSAAKKYEMHSVLEDSVRSFEALLPTASLLRAYTLACLLELPDIVRRSAKLLLARDPNCFEAVPMPPEFRTLPCEVMYVFAVYRGKFRKAALSVVDDSWEWLLSGDHRYKMLYSNKGNPHMHSTWIWLSCTDCGEDDTTRGLWAGRKSARTFLRPRKWYARYIRGIMDILVECPSPEIPGEAALRERALSEAASCGTCAPLAPLQLPEFARLLLIRLQAALGEITLELPFKE
ncbi:hypothetical protein K466DRAFT_524312 [Polyporus arcularius HHB13444]|uniref:BTB domain-containing protein n=1 Tax=Polyporus arcularius HHB13444 TaxID=1314778 RepID=A0A5C3PCK6_9APHY|nr:hypothetical protein K466DRAFT_524312 [Polyporus arcularius HHB13444]